MTQATLEERAGAVSRFRERLLKIMDKKDHWAWKYFSSDLITKDQLKIHFQQEYAVYIRDFPVFLARIHAKNPPMEVRKALAENLYEEETGGLTVGRLHPELFLQMMEGLGYSIDDFSTVRLLPESRRYRNWLEQVTTKRPWLEAAAVITIFVEGSIRDRMEIDPTVSLPPTPIEQKIRQHPLVRFHQVPPACMDLVRAHHSIEGSHRLAAWKMVLDQATDRSQQQAIHEALKRSLALWLSYRNGIAKACGLKP